MLFCSNFFTMLHRALLEQLLYHAGLVPNQIIEFNSLGAMLASICAGLGMSFLPTSVISRYVQDGLMNSYAVPKAYSIVSTVFIYRKDHFINAAFSKFLNSIEKSFSI